MDKTCVRAPYTPVLVRHGYVLNVQYPALHERMGCHRYPTSLQNQAKVLENNVGTGFLGDGRGGKSGGRVRSSWGPGVIRTSRRWTSMPSSDKDHITD